MDKRRQSKRNSEEYSQLVREITHKCIEAKKIWLSIECKEIEKQYNVDSKNTHKRINQLTGRKMQSNAGCLKSKYGDILMEKEQLLERWTEYIQDLYDDERPEQTKLTECEGPPILESEVRNALKYTMVVKAPVPDNITSEIFAALEDFGTKKQTNSE